MAAETKQGWVVDQPYALQKGTSDEIFKLQALTYNTHT